MKYRTMLAALGLLLGFSVQAQGTIQVCEDSCKAQFLSCITSCPSVPPGTDPRQSMGCRNACGASSQQCGLKCNPAAADPMGLHTPKPATPAIAPEAAPQPAAEQAPTARDQQPALTVKSGHVSPGIAALAALGAILVFIGWLYAVIRGFYENIAWGLAILFFSPLALLLFAAVNWDRGRLPVMLIICGSLIAGAAFVTKPSAGNTSIQVSRSYVTNQACASDDTGLNGRNTSFGGGDFVCMKTVVTVGESGTHRMTWVWLDGNREVAHGARDVEFVRHTMTLTSPQTPALTFGSYHVEIHADGQLLDSQAFEIR